MFNFKYEKMNSLSSNELIEVFTIIQGIVTFIMLIVFFVMASNIDKLRNVLHGDQSPEYYEELARREVFKGNKQKAVDLLHEAIYIFKNKSGENSWQLKQNYKYAKKIVIRINKAGGTISQELADIMDEYSRRFDQ